MQTTVLIPIFHVYLGYPVKCYLVECRSCICKNQIPNRRHSFFSPHQMHRAAFHTQHS